MCKSISYIRIYSIVSYKFRPAKNEFRNPARIHSPDPFLRAGNAVSVLPNQNPQKIVWENRVHRIGTRIPSVSPSRRNSPLASPPPYRKKKKEIAPNKKRMCGGEARAERNSRSGGRLSYPTVWWSGGCAVTEFVVERTITFHITAFSERATFITSLCFENRF